MPLLLQTNVQTPVHTHMDAQVLNRSFQVLVIAHLHIPRQKTPHPGKWNQLSPNVHPSLQIVSSSFSVTIPSAFVVVSWYLPTQHLRLLQFLLFPHLVLNVFSDTRTDLAVLPFNSQALKVGVLVFS